MTVLLIISFVLLILFSAFFSGSEIVMSSASQIRLQNAAEQGSRSAKLALKLTEHYTSMISAILVGNNIANIASSTIATVFFVSVLQITASRGELYSSVAVTLILLVFGEIYPKIIADEFADFLIGFIVWPLRFFMLIFTPITWLVTRLIAPLSKLWTPRETQPAVTAEELCTMVEEIEEEGVFTEQESELIRSAIEFTDVTAQEVMTPRVDVYAFDIEDGEDALLQNEELLQFARFPVYRETSDNIIGILSVDDFLRHRAAGDKTAIEDMLRPPLYVHMTRTVSSILHEFRRTRSHMAIVADEFGGMMGILTREDIIEEIVGEIFDEKDDVEYEIRPVENNVYMVDGGMNIEDMFEAIGFNDPDFESEYSTVGGFATEILDRFPKVGDTFTYHNLEFKIIAAQSHRVEQLSVTVLPEEEEDHDNRESES